MTIQPIINSNSIKNGSAVVSVGKKGNITNHVIPPAINQTEEVTATSGELAYKYNSDFLYYALINVAAGATSTIVPAIDGQSINVVDYTILAGADTDVSFLSDTTYLARGMEIAERRGISANSDGGLFETNDGEALKLSTTSGTINGHVSYNIW